MFVVSAMGLDFQFYCALFIYLCPICKEKAETEREPLPVCGTAAVSSCCCPLDPEFELAVGNVCGELKTFMTLTKRRQKKKYL